MVLINLREVDFILYYSKYKGQTCHGIQIHISNRDRLHSVNLGLSLIYCIHDLYPNELEWIKRDGEFHFDYLVGMREIRKMIESSEPLDSILALCDCGLERFRKLRENYLLY